MPLLIGKRAQHEGSWQNLTRIHRLEYPFPVHYFCYAIWGSCYAVSSVRHITDVPVLLAIAANLLLIVALNVLNAAVDVRTDALTPHKRAIATAVLSFGHRRALWWAAAELALALALSTAASLWTGRWLITGAVSLIIVLHLLYNLEPVRLKRRAFANPITFGLSIGFLPSIASYSAVRADFSAAIWLIFASLGVLVTARAWWWSVPDATGDAATRMTTPAVRYGATRTLAVSCLITVAGLSLLGWGISWHYGPGWGLLAVAAGLTFLIAQFEVLLRAVDHCPPTSAGLRRRSLPWAVLANVVLVSIPLAVSSLSGI
jgi:4-hydroxybenzoate polyprenyltransferase